MSVEGWQNFAKLLIRKPVIKKCRARYYYTGMAADICAPFLVIGNHTTMYDPFLLSLGLKEPIRYVTSDLYFRNPVLSFLAKKAGCIPKAKFVSDIQIIKALIKCRDRRQAVGVFPEGYRIWDGQTDYIPLSTAKLIKLLKIPVIAAVNKGGYLSMPRWAKLKRKGKMEFHYSLILNPKEISELPVDQIYKIIVNALNHNDTAWQRDSNTAYRGKKLAESLELMLYCCPECHRFETMVSHENKFYCLNCGYEVIYDEYGFFQTKTNHKMYFDNAFDWRKFCDQELERRICSSDEYSQIFRKRDVVLWREKESGRLFKRYAHGTISLCRSSFVFSKDNENIVFPFSEIKGLTISKKNMIDFYYNGIKYRIDPQSKTRSGLFWEQGYKILSGKKTESCSFTDI